MKCPVCGYTYGSMKEQGKKIEDLLKQRSKSLRKLIRKLHRDVVHSVPAERWQKTFWSFLKRIEHIEDREVSMAIYDFYKANHLNYGRGLSYLKAIIVNKHINKGKNKKMEKKRLGSTPPLREVRQ